jgi:uncharacterized membrane protein YphA (DoxX/SURF4 family)
MGAQLWLRFRFGSNVPTSKRLEPAAAFLAHVVELLAVGCSSCLFLLKCLLVRFFSALTSCVLFYYYFFFRAC